VKKEALSTEGGLMLAQVDSKNETKFGEGEDFQKAFEKVKKF
jgi:hypothetical protein